MGGRNHEVVTAQPLLNQEGNIAEPGWSRKQVQVYARDAIKAPANRIKEWDYYLILSQEFAVALTLADNGYMGMQSVSFLDFTKPWQHTETVIDPAPMGKYGMPADSSKGDCNFESERVTIRYRLENGGRRIICDFKQFDGEKDFSCDIFLRQPDMDTMVIATPWPEPTTFYYNQKINCMRAEGTVVYDGKTYTFHPETDFGTLDWGRGVWTLDNVWYWGSGNCDIEGKAFGFNIGYGFGDTTAATENVLFYDGKAHKLDDVTCEIPEDDFCKPWKVTSSDGRFEMDFIPIIDRWAYSKHDWILSDQHQVFGRLSGTAVLDDGTKIPVKDLLCFIEKVHNIY